MTTIAEVMGKSATDLSRDIVNYALDMAKMRGIDHATMTQAVGAAFLVCMAASYPDTESRVMGAKLYSSALICAMKEIGALKGKSQAKAGR